MNAIFSGRAILIALLFFGVEISFAQGPVVFALNAGGQAYSSTSDAIDYLKDTLVSGGGTYRGSAVPISGTADPELYLTERWGTFSYAIPLPNGNYTLSLRFAEIYWNAPGRRVFNVLVNDSTVLPQYDIFADVGKNVAVEKIFPATVTNGVLRVSLRAVVDGAKLSALVVRSNSSGAPQITTQPSNQQVTIGQPATFQVGVIGAAPLAYQWHRNGVAIAGATGSSYTLSAAAKSDSGATFRCVVSNGQGSATSNSARLDVVSPVPPSITGHPSAQTVFEGQSASFAVVAVGSTPLSYQWQKNGVNVSNATSSSYVLPTVSLADSGASFRCIVTNSAGSVISNAAVLTVNRSVGGTILFAANAGGERYVSPATGIVYSKDSLVSGGNTYRSSNRPILDTDDDDMYLTERWGMFSYNIPVSNGEYEVELKFCETYWTQAGQRIFHVNIEEQRVLSNFDLLTIVQRNTAYDRRFLTSVNDGVLNVRFTPVVDNARLSGIVVRSVSSTPQPPVVTTQPVNQSVTEGGTASFSVAANGSQPLAFQWQRNGVNVQGATSSMYTISQVSGSDSGSVYRALVSNAAGSVMSNEARLDVFPVQAVAPSITAQPVDQTVTVGQTATFSVTATGTLPLSYQWQKNTQNISGANAPSYTTPAATASDSGSTFRCIVTNSAGSAASSVATLRVNSTAPSGGNIIFATNSAGPTYTSSSGLVYAADEFFSGGNTFTLANAPVTGTDDVMLFRSERWGTFSYNIPVANGEYEVVLRFAEIYWGESGRRIFNVAIEGSQRLSNFDIFAAAGKNVAIDRTFAVTVNDGQLNIVFSAVVDNPKVSALIVRSQSSSPMPPVITQHPIAQTVTQGQPVTFSVQASGTAPLAYQWQRNEVSIIGATSPSYSILQSSQADSGARFSCVVSNSHGSARSNTALLTVLPPSSSGSGNIIFAANAGGQRFVSPVTNIVYGNDSLVSGGNAYTSSTRDILGTEDDQLYLSERWGTFSYAIPVQNGEYEVELKFCETYWSQPGQRIFHVNIEGTRVLSDFDILAIVPKNTAHDRTFLATVNDGILNVQFIAVRDNARLSGIVVRSQGPPSPPSITTHPASVSVDEGATAQFSVAATGNQLQFQWQKNGVNISGATGPSYTTPATVASDNGSTFRVVVANPAGTVTSNSATLTVRPAEPATANGPWWNTRWRYRVPLTIGANGFLRTNSVANVSINFTQLLASFGVNGGLNTQSIRVVEVNANGEAIDTNAVFQFDPGTAFHATTNATGTLAVLLSGTTASNALRNFHVYFDTNSGFTLPAFASQVSLADNIMFQGQSSYRITNQLGTMWYHKTGGGFAGLKDLNNVEWIGYNSTPGSGGAGEYRGIPNLGVYGHPGYTNGSSIILSQGPIKITIQTVTTDASNARWIWEFYPTHQTMTLQQSGVNYWFLYEGTPAGDLNQSTGYVKTSAGQTLNLGSTFAADLPGPEWAYFGMTGQQRFLYFVHHEDDAHIDHYRPFPGPMTVFGFGRDGSSVNRYMSATPQRFSFGFGEQETQSADIINATFRALTITTGSAQRLDPPVISQHPADRNASPGQTVTFTVAASGLAPLTYQWQKNGTNINGATSASYITPSLSRADSGALFRCVVSNPAGSVVSNAALLRVITGMTTSLAFRHSIIDLTGPRNPHCKALGDINGDGFKDVLAASSSNLTDGLFWYEYPTWRKTRITTGSFSTAMALGDVDGDGDLDVIIPKGDYYGNSVWWYENPRPAGNPATAPWTERLIGNAGAHDVVVGDINRDGKLDVIVRVGNATTLFIQNSGFTWTKSVINTRPFEGTALGDVDGDGDLDVVTNGYWLENPLPTGNPSSGMWTERVVVAGWTDKAAAAVADLDGDGKMDIILAPSETANGRMSWFKTANPKTGPWIETIIDETVSYIHTLQAADVDNNGLVDIFTGEMHQSTDPDEVSIYLNFDNGARWTQHIVSTSGTHNAHIGDIDGDGDLDLFGANWSSDAPNKAVLEWWQNISGNLLPLNSWRRHVIESSRPWRAIFIDAADLDGDSFKDIVAGAWWYRNPGRAAGQWTRSVIGSPLNNMAALYDFDNDGRVDILGTKGIDANRNSEFVWGKNNGTGAFTIHQNITAGEGDFLQGVAVARFAGNQLEVALSWHEAGRGVQMLTVPTNPVTATWGWRRISTTSQDEQLSAGDIDRDGDTDLMLGTKWLRNDGTTWTPFTLFNPSGPGQTDPDRNRLVDINGDGRVDVVVGYEALGIAGKLAWYAQPANPTSLWTERVIATNLIGPMSLDIADMDGDGDPDIIVGEHNYNTPSTSRLLVFENQDGAGGSWRQHVVHTGDEHHDGAIVVDIDNDGDLDILSLGWTNSFVLLYENTAIVNSLARPGSVKPVATDARTEKYVPDKYALRQNFPNPFNPSTAIEFDIPEAGHVSIRLYDVLGREVKTILSDFKQPGRFSVTLNANSLASGTYIYRMQAGVFVDSRRMIIVK